VEVWSDGGPKHFKCTQHLLWLAQFQKELGRNVPIHYNFFAAHHGFNICDTAASHAKRALKAYQLRTGEPITSSEVVVATISGVKNHSARLAERAPAMEKPKTARGIKSFHSFHFVAIDLPGPNEQIRARIMLEVRAHKTSQDYFDGKRYSVLSRIQN
jgi:hypothetical protein